MKKAILFGGIIILCLSIYRQYRTQTTVTPTIVTHSVESTGGGYSGRVDEGISTTEIMPITGNDQKDLEILEGEQYENTIENEILENKKNEILEKSFLQEIYGIRNIISVSGGIVFFNISFDLHSSDCGSPDCYQTEVSFHFKLGNTFKFPQKIPFQEHEDGCDTSEKKISGTFELQELNEKYVIYYSTKYNRTLVLFSSNKESGTYAYYVTDAKQNQINSKNVYQVLKYLNKEGSFSYNIYRSSNLLRYEYSSPTD